MKHSAKLAALLGLVTLAACVHRARGVVPPEPAMPELPEMPAVGVEPGVLPVAAPRPLRAGDYAPLVEDMSLREKAAQLVMPRIPGDYWANDDAAARQALALVTDEHVGGFVVGTASSPYDLAFKLNMLQRASRLPLLIAADLESGPGMRFRGGTAFSGNMALGATGSPADAYAVGRIIAREARAVGIQMDFAPVVDVNNNPANPIINTRSFGEDPAAVGRMGAAFIGGLRDNGVLATAKHFPGHGDTGTDSHIAVPVIFSGLARLDSVELVPFRSAVAAGVDAVMSAHIALPNVTGDSALPATLSPMVLDTILRGQLGFRGLIVTDALNMGAVVSRYGAAQAAVLAFKAGADILLMPTDVHGAVDGIVEAVQRGEVTPARLDSSVARVLEAKERLGLFRRRVVDPAQIPRYVGTSEDQAAADSIAQQSLVLARDDSGLVPLQGAHRRVLLVAVGDEGNTYTGVTLAAELRRQGVSVQTARLYPASGPASYDSVRTAAAQAGVTIIVASAHPVAFQPSAVEIPDSAAALEEQLAARHLPLIVVSTGSPYLINQMPSAPTYLLAWSGSDAAERAAADALVGAIGVTGRLPVALPPYFPLGGGLSRAPVVAASR